MRLTSPNPQTPPPPSPAHAGPDGPLAEFAVLREEIPEKMRTQEQIMTLQLTVTACNAWDGTARQPTSYR
jgi:hypothetical protein